MSWYFINLFQYAVFKEQISDYLSSHYITKKFHYLITIQIYVIRSTLSGLSCFFQKFGSHLSFHTVTSIVFSAAQVLTIVFGMGTGVTPRRIATKIRYYQANAGCYENNLWTGSLIIFLQTICSECCEQEAFASNYLLYLPNNWTVKQPLLLFLRKEVIQPHLPIRLPCYDFTPVIIPAFGGSFLTVRSPTSGIYDSHGVTGGVYKTRERIHRSILICDY